MQDRLPRDPPRKRRRAQALGQHVAPLLTAAFRSQGFADQAIHLAWDALVGADLAAHSEPIGLQWRRRPVEGDERGRSGGVLTVKVVSAFALRFQYAQGDLVKRINVHLGWPCIESIRLVQGPVHKRRKAPARPAATLSPEAEAQLVADLAPIADERLREALARLGRAIRART
jgi:hypothetical protein